MKQEKMHPHLPLALVFLGSMFIAVFIVGVYAGSELLGMPRWAWWTWATAAGLTAYFALTSKPARLPVIAGPFVGLCFFYLVGALGLGTSEVGTDANSQRMALAMAEMSKATAWIGLLVLPVFSAIVAALMRFEKMGTREADPE